MLDKRPLGSETPKSPQTGGTNPIGMRDMERTMWRLNIAILVCIVILCVAVVTTFQGFVDSLDTSPKPLPPGKIEVYTERSF